jgi:hypothetical protein
MRLLLLGIAVLGGTILSAQAAVFQRGEQVLVHHDDGTLASPPRQTVVALAGDRLRIDHTGVYVNDRKVTTLPSRVVEILPPENETIPAGHIFVAGEGGEGNSVGRAWNLIPLTRIGKETPR